MTTAAINEDSGSQQRIQEWATKLVDLSRRNRLLYYRATKRTTLTFRHPHPDAIFRSVVDGKPFDFYRPPDLPPLVPGRARETTPLEDELQRRPPRDRELVTTQRDPAEIHKSLEAISRKAHAEYEDRGTHVLYLAWNLLRWNDARTGEEQRAPLVVTPVDVSRAPYEHTYKLRSPEDGEPLVNPALRVKLQTDFGLLMPDLDLEDMETAEALAELRSTLPPGSEIEPHASVGIFGFAKEAMYRDLVDNSGVVARHPVIRSLIARRLVEGAAGPAASETRGTTGKNGTAPAHERSFSVIDADSTQMDAIEAANRGQSFVLEGPPGTGKSQTISNIIAESIGHGKSVLFVSEKMAALEVVAKRLQATELSGLILELHSAKANRKQVAEALAKALDGHPAANDAAATAANRAAATSAAVLDGYVAALHAERKPLGRSAYDVLSELSTLTTVPALDAPAIDAASASPDDLATLQRMVERLQDAWLPVEDGDRFPWLGMQVTTGNAALRERASDVLLRARESVVALERLDQTLGHRLELPLAESQATRQARCLMSHAISRRTSIPAEWLTRDDTTPYAALLRRWEQRSQEHAQSVSAIEAAHGPEWRSLDPGTHAELVVSLSNVASLLGLGDASVAGQVLDGSTTYLDAARRLPGELADALGILDELRASLGLTGSASRDSARQALEIARLSQSRHRPPKEWLSKARLDDADMFLTAHGPKYLEWQQGTQTLRAGYEPALLELDLDGLIDRMGRWHGHWWNRLRPTYRADTAAIRAVTKGGSLLPGVLNDLAQARRVRATRAELTALDRQARVVLGPYSNALATDIVAARKAASVGRRLLHAASGSSVDWGRLGAVATAEAPHDPEIERRADRLEKALGTLEQTLSVLVGPAAGDAREATLAWEQETTGRWIADLVAQLERLRALRERLAPAGHAVAAADLLKVARLREAIDRLEADLETDEPVLRAALRSLYAGFATDWESLRKGAEWSEAMRTSYGGALPEPVARDLLSGELDDLPWQDYGIAIEAVDRAAAETRALSPGVWGDHAQAVLTGKPDEAKAWVDLLVSRIEDLEVWQAYQVARAELDRAGWSKFVDVATKRRIVRTDVVPAFRRAWLDGWFTSLAAGEEALGGFSRQVHERAVQAFRSGDSQVVHLGRELVLREYGRRIPPPATIPGSEQAIIRRAALRKRGLVPVRTLLGSIPTLLPRLKPCLMMSPLSVSHFLTPETTFDLVVFDEASQVPPEDAINCIYRGRQLVVAGDSRQLPPTSFFRLMAQSEDDGDEVEDDIDDFESVLDLCKATGFAPYPLLWHYRSRHDALIAFSNRHIYDDKLITFPAPYTQSSELGVRFEYVPNASFDRGRSAKNESEARRVVELVVQHWKQHPQESVGVVAFSVAQQEAVQDAMAATLEDRPDLQRHLGSDRLDGFFVKNLETVQGDERDVIVFTIGYGPDENGKIFRNFGALSRAGGDRRLNVAVTRARKRVVVVSSMRASDLDKAGGTTTTRGPRLLRDYLEYAERGVLPEVGHERDLEPGRLEHDLADVIQRAGWEVVEQVGTSQYRIDLGVVSKVQPGRLVLGVECDGWMYRNARNTRDRDRLRPSVLHDLGWTIHRVWALDWYQHRQTETRRLIDAIEGAERALVNGALHVAGLPPKPLEMRAHEEREEILLNGPDDAVKLGWARYYDVSRVTPYSHRPWREFHDPDLWRAHAERIASLVTAEGPMHQKAITRRLTEEFGLARAGNRIQEAVLAAIAIAERGRSVKQRGSFAWPADGDLQQVRVPLPGRDDTVRVIDLIPPEELELALLRITETSGSIDPDQLLVAAARVLGFDRTGEKIQTTLRIRLNGLLASGRLERSGEMVALGPSASLPRVKPVAGHFGPGGLGSCYRHPRRGVGRLVQMDGTIWTLDFSGEKVRFDSTKTELTPVPC